MNTTGVTYSVPPVFLNNLQNLCTKVSMIWCHLSCLMINVFKASQESVFTDPMKRRWPHASNVLDYINVGATGKGGWLVVCWRAIAKVLLQVMERDIHHRVLHQSILVPQTTNIHTKWYAMNNFKKCIWQRRHSLLLHYFRSPSYAPACQLQCLLRVYWDNSPVFQSFKCVNSEEVLLPQYLLHSSCWTSESKGWVLESAVWYLFGPLLSKKTHKYALQEHHDKLSDIAMFDVL